MVFIAIGNFPTVIITGKSLNIRVVLITMAVQKTDQKPTVNPTWDPTYFVEKVKEKLESAVQDVKHECVKKHTTEILISVANNIRRPEHVIPVLFNLNGASLYEISGCDKMNRKVAEDVKRLFEAFFMTLTYYAREVVFGHVYYRYPAIDVELRFSWGTARMHWLFDHVRDKIKIVYYYFDSEWD